MKIQQTTINNNSTGFDVIKLLEATRKMQVENNEKEEIDTIYKNIQTIREWLAQNKKRVSALEQEKIIIEASGNVKNKIFQLLRINTLLGRNTILGKEVEEKTIEIEKEILEKEKKIFLEIIKEYKTMEAHLLAENNINIYNEELLKTVVNNLIRHHNISNETGEKIINFLKTAFNTPRYQFSEEQQDELANINASCKGIYQVLWDIDIDNYDNIPANEYYRYIISLFIKESIKQKIEQTEKNLNNKYPSFQKERTQIVESIINPKTLDTEQFDIQKVPINDLLKLSGLQRWNILKSLKTFPAEVFDMVEKIIIQRLNDEALFPGGRESINGSRASNIINNLNNPIAIPLLLRHVEIFGDGHTSKLVGDTIVSLLEKSDPERLNAVLETLPENKKKLLHLLTDEKSCFKRFGERRFMCFLLQHGDSTLAKEVLTKVLEENNPHLKFDDLSSFFNSHTNFRNPEHTKLLLQSKNILAQAIAKSKLDTWTLTEDKILTALVSDEDNESNKILPFEIIKSIGIENDETVKKMLGSKNFKKSIFDRKALVNGLLLLNSKENGKEVLENLLNRYKGAKKDDARMRRIFQFLSILNNFGEYDFIKPSANAIQNIIDRIEEIKNKMKNIQDKKDKKELEKQLKTLTLEKETLEGLKGIEDLLRIRTIEIVQKKLNIPQSYQDIFQRRFDALMQRGELEIMIILSGQYEKKNEQEVQKLLREIIKHVISDDFIDWKYKNEGTQSAFKNFSEQQIEIWKNNEKKEIEINKEQYLSEKKENQKKTIQQILNNASVHIAEKFPLFNLNISNDKINDLNTKISNTNNIAEKEKFENEKIMIELFLNIAQEINGDFRENVILDYANQLIKKLNEIGLATAELDIKQLFKVFQRKDPIKINIQEVDDPLNMLRIGVEPFETCQSWRNGIYNECLLAYVADGNKKAIIITDEHGKIIARSILKLINYKKENGEITQGILVEPMYSLNSFSGIDEAMIKILSKKAYQMNVSLILGYHYDNDKKRLEIFTNILQEKGFSRSQKDTEVFIPKSNNPYEYSDTYGGKMQHFNQYHLCENSFIFEKTR